METLVKKITEEVFDCLPTEISPITGKGLVNLVYKIRANNQYYILRLQKGELALKNFKKEFWCINKAKKNNILTPKCLNIGIKESYAFSVQEYVDGMHAEDFNDQKYVWIELGKIARQIHTIGVGGFGEDFKYEGNKSGVSTWHDFFECEEKFALDYIFFVKTEVFSTEEVKKIKEKIEYIRHQTPKAFLCHGNLTPRNAIIDKNNQLHVIDFGSACGFAVPDRDIAELLAWNTAKENLDLFLKGYGLEEVDYIEKNKKNIDALILLRLLGVVRWGIENKEDWRKESFVTDSIEKIKSILS